MTLARPLRKLTISVKLQISKCNSARHPAPLGGCTIAGAILILDAKMRWSLWGAGAVLPDTAPARGVSKPGVEKDAAKTWSDSISEKTFSQTCPQKKTPQARKGYAWTLKQTVKIAESFSSCHHEFHQLLFLRFACSSSWPAFSPSFAHPPYGHLWCWKHWNGRAARTPQPYNSQGQPLNQKWTLNKTTNRGETMEWKTRFSNIQKSAIWSLAWNGREKNSTFIHLKKKQKHYVAWSIIFISKNSNAGLGRRKRTDSTARSIKQCNCCSRTPSHKQEFHQRFLGATEEQASAGVGLKSKGTWRKVTPKKLEKQKKNCTLCVCQTLLLWRAAKSLACPTVQIKPSGCDPSVLKYDMMAHSSACIFLGLIKPVFHFLFLVFGNIQPQGKVLQRRAIVAPIHKTRLGFEVQKNDSCVRAFADI